MVSRLFSFLGRSATAEDPVCNMKVDTKDPPGGSLEHEGSTYYFCGKGCRLEFEEDPQGHLSGEKKMEM